MAISQYDKLEEDREWMNNFGCIRIVEECDENERNKYFGSNSWLPCKGDELVIPKFSNAIRGSRELATFLEFCRVKAIRVISIHDRIDSKNQLFPQTKPSDVLEMMGAFTRRSTCFEKDCRAYGEPAGEDDCIITEGFFHKITKARQRKRQLSICMQPVIL